MNVVLLSPAYPPEMRQFTRGLAEAGARVIGVGDRPTSELPNDVRHLLSAYLEVRSLWDEAEVLVRVREAAVRVGVDRVECLWEPGMLLAARLREALGLPGMRVEETVPFRDKEIMKQVLDRAGIRTPRHARVATVPAAKEAAAAIGFPVILKPIAGAGAIDTHRAGDWRELESAIELVRHVPEISVEEFVDGEEFTFDTIAIDGRVVFFNISWYRPRPLDGKLHEWISPQAIALRDVDEPRLAGGRDMGFRVLRALGFRTGFTHMEWYRKPDGEAVFGEIAARPPGANAVEIMNFANDVDLFRGWAEAVCHGRFSSTWERRYNCAIVFKRAHGQGRIRHVEGLDGLLGRFGPHVAKVDLLAVGEPRRDWKQVQISDGFVILRHPDLAETIRMADAVATDLRIYAG